MSIESNSTLDMKVMPQKSRRTKLIVLVGVFLVALLVAVLILVSRYNPLSWSAVGKTVSEVITSEGGIAPHHLEMLGNSLDEGTVWAGPKNNFRVILKIAIKNEGSFPINIEKIVNPWVAPYNTHFAAFLEPGTVPKTEFSLTRELKFHPESLASRQSIVLVVAWTERCSALSPGALNTFSSLQVVDSFFGLYHTTNVAISPFAIRNPLTCEGVS